MLRALAERVTGVETRVAGHDGELVRINSEANRLVEQSHLAFGAGATGALWT